MSWILPVLLIFIIGCSQQDDAIKVIEEVTIQNEALKLLAEDKKNKELELVYLNEIRIAQENDDIDAYEFYLNEYINVPRLDVPEDLKNHPKYFLGGKHVKY